MNRINRNISEFGPWNLNQEPVDNTSLNTARDSHGLDYPLLTHRTIKLPRITPIEESLPHKKLEVKLSKQSLELIASRFGDKRRVTGMSGSVLQFYKGRDKAKQSRYQSISVDITPRTLSRKVSTIQMGQPEAVKCGEVKREGHFFNGESSKKRSLQWVIQEMKGRQHIIDRYILDHRKK